MSSPTSLRHKVIRGSTWTTLGFGTSYAIRLVSTLFLTRLLTPDVFGLMALASVFLTAVAMFSDLGTRPSVIRSPRGDDAAFLRTAWTIQTLRGGAICLVVCALAWPAALLYDQPVLFPLLCALSLCAVFEGFVSISVATCRRHIQLSRITAMDISVQLGTTVLNVLAAWYLQSVWALVIGSLFGSALRLALSFLWLPRFAHRFQLERAALREIVSFGRWLLLATLLTYVGGKGSQAVMGALVDIETLGFIAIATTLSWALGDLTQKLLSNTVFPSLSQINRDRPQDLRRAIGRVKRTITFGFLPAFIALSVFSQPLIDLLYDPRYAEVGALVRLFALNGAIGVMSMPYQNLVLAKGDGRYHAQFMFMTAILRLAGLFLGYQLFGVYGMIAGIGAGNAIAFGLAAWWAHRHKVAHLAHDILVIGGIGLVYALSLGPV